MFSKNEDIRDIQKTALSIFKEFRRICEENNLRFYTSGGTTIGALLYKGFIPLMMTSTSICRGRIMSGSNSSLRPSCLAT